MTLKSKNWHSQAKIQNLMKNSNSGDLWQNEFPIKIYFCCASFSLQLVIDLTKDCTANAQFFGSFYQQMDRAKWFADLPNIVHHRFDYIKVL